MAVGLEDIAPTEFAEPSRVWSKNANFCPLEFIFAVFPACFGSRKVLGAPRSEFEGTRNVFRGTRSVFVGASVFFCLSVFPEVPGTRNGSRFPGREESSSMPFTIRFRDSDVLYMLGTQNAFSLLFKQSLEEGTSVSLMAVRVCKLLPTLL